MMPNKNIAARLTIPAIALYGYFEMLFRSGTKMQALWTGVIALPLLVIGLWLLFVPTFVKFNDDGSQITIVKVLRKTVVPYDQVERIAKKHAGFARLYLVSSESLLFILEEKDEYQIRALSHPK